MPRPQCQEPNQPGSINNPRDRYLLRQNPGKVIQIATQLVPSAAPEGQRPVLSNRLATHGIYLSFEAVRGHLTLV